MIKMKHVFLFHYILPNKNRQLEVSLLDFLKRRQHYGSVPLSKHCCLSENPREVCNSWSKLSVNILHHLGEGCLAHTLQNTCLVLNGETYFFAPRKKNCNIPASYFCNLTFLTYFRKLVL